jgi:polyisoprenoid-binding protein YceI
LKRIASRSTAKLATLVAALAALAHGALAAAAPDTYRVDPELSSTEFAVSHLGMSTIKRSDFGLTYALGLVGDDIDLSFQVTAFRAQR